ncbi:MAG TPA: hypothetical protein VD994_11955 [Prosthecobacter sp.]|nr:hypothetical protein [Prosthecobacter sp.]
MNTRTLLTAAFTLLAALASSRAADPKPASEFTTTDPKKVELIKEGEDSATYRCPGLGGYQVIFEQAHGRSWINLVWDSETLDLMDATLNAAKGDFPTKANHVVQWRGYRDGDNFSPYAVIYRVKALNEEGQPIETFIIIQCAQGATRVVGSLPASKGNKAAEALADKLCNS